MDQPHWAVTSTNSPHIIILRLKWYYRYRNKGETWVYDIIFCMKYNRFSIRGQQAGMRLSGRVFGLYAWGAGLNSKHPPPHNKIRRQCFLKGLKEWALESDLCVHLGKSASLSFCFLSGGITVQMGIIMELLRVDMRVKWNNAHKALPNDT